MGFALKGGSSRLRKHPSTLANGLCDLLGQVIYFREADRVAIVGDVLRNISFLTGKPRLGELPGFLTVDLKESHRSIRTLAQLRPSMVCFGHGPVLYDMEQLDRLVARLP